MLHNGAVQVFTVVAVEFQGAAKSALKVEHTAGGFLCSGSALTVGHCVTGEPVGNGEYPSVPTLCRRGKRAAKVTRIPVTCCSHSTCLQGSPFLVFGMFSAGTYMAVPYPSLCVLHHTRSVKL